ncbi:hypothetical protein [Nonomuraea sp. NPDC049625]|uniref:hypothetical protein n=1 Tax=Nonomuraea sp. NPDC049625 TaxID=3155775 RepID=UPI00342B3F11
MSRRLLRWAGVLLAAGSAIAMTGYLLTVDRADPRVSALGALLGLAGLALAAHARPDRRDDDS